MLVGCVGAGRCGRSGVFALRPCCTKPVVAAIVLIVRALQACDQVDPYLRRRPRVYAARARLSVSDSVVAHSWVDRKVVEQCAVAALLVVQPRPERDGLERQPVSPSRRFVLKPSVHGLAPAIRVPVVVPQRTALPVREEQILALGRVRVPR